MTSSTQFLNSSEAASRLGVSVKALRLYEQRGLITPIRTEARWRAYGPHEMSRAAEIVSLRALGFSLAQIKRVLEGDPSGLEPALAAHQAILDDQLRQLVGRIEKVRQLRDDLARGEAPTVVELAGMMMPNTEFKITIDLPWPWGGEQFALIHVTAEFATHRGEKSGSSKRKLDDSRANWSVAPIRATGDTRFLSIIGFLSAMQRPDRRAPVSTRNRCPPRPKRVSSPAESIQISRRHHRS